MSLVAYGSSDSEEETDIRDETISCSTKTSNLGISKGKTEEALLSAEKPNEEESKEQDKSISGFITNHTLKKQRETIKITLPSLDQFKDEESEPKKKPQFKDQTVSQDVEVIEKQIQNIEQIKEPSGKKRKTVVKSLNAQRSSQNSRPLSVTEEALFIMKNIQAHDTLKDQYTAFGEQVGMRIRDLPSPHAKKIVKHLISNILFEAEMGKYDNPNSFPPPLPQHPWYSDKMPASYQSQQLVTSPTQSSQGCTDSESIDSGLMEI